MSEDWNKLNFRELSGRTAVEWQVKDFLKLSHANSKRIESPTIWVSNFEWQLWFYPNGSNRQVKDYVSLHLARLTGKDPVLTSVTFTIKVNESVIKSTNFEKTYEENEVNTWGIPQFLQRVELIKHLTPESSNNSAAMDGGLPFTIVCSVCVLNDKQKCDVSTQTSKLDNSVKVLTKNLEDIYFSQKLSDVKIKIDTKDYSAHKAILAARSPVFASMFEHEMTENLNGIIEITDCDSDSFELFLKFLYSGNLDKISSTNSVGLYKIADKYCVENLKEISSSFMIENLELNSICDVLELAIQHGEKELLNTGIEFFTKNLKAIIPSENWKRFILEKTVMANEILIQMSKTA